MTYLNFDLFEFLSAILEKDLLQLPKIWFCLRCITEIMFPLIRFRLIMSNPGSMLHAMFSGRFDAKPIEGGSYFIDRDGTYFRYILPKTR